MEKDYFYNAIIIALVLGIIISIFSVSLTRDKPAEFTELYFENHRNLPENASPYTTYKFGYSAESHMSTLASHDIKTKVELYNIYDITEGTYNCIGRSRPKIEMEWTPENETNYQIISKFEKDADYDETFTPMRLVFANDETRQIPWSTYRFEFSLEPSYPVGYTILNMTDFVLIFDYENNLTTAQTIDGEESAYAEYNIGRGNDFTLVINRSHIELLKKDQSLMNFTATETRRTPVFKQLGNYAMVRRMKAYVNKPFSVTEPDTVFEYGIQNNNFIRYTQELSQKRLSTINFQRNYYDVGLYDQFADILQIPTPELNQTYITSYVVFSLQNESQEINWSKYELQFNTNEYSGEGTFGVRFIESTGEPAYGFIFQRLNGDAMFFEYLNSTRVRITHNPQVEQKVSNRVDFIKNDSHITLMINNEIAFDREIDDYGPVNMTMFASKSIIQFDNIRIYNREEECTDPVYFGECEKRYRLSDIYRPSARSQQAEETISVASSFGKALDRITRIGEINYSAIGEHKNVTPEDLGTNFVLSLLAQNLTNYNPFIPDRRLEFNGPSAVLKDWNDHEFKAQFVPLDGSLLLGISFIDENGIEQFKYIIDIKKDKAYVKVGDDIDEVNEEFSDNDEQNVIVRFDQGTTYFLHNYEPIIIREDLNLTSGHYVLETYNSYLDFKSLTARNMITDATKRFSDAEDPCELRLIGKQILRDESFTLLPQQKKSFEDQLVIEQDFDFGKVTVNLTDINQSIHYWVTRR